uniref:Uncharacterized protein n=1 Tax=Cacopsylla melanoneura TaxID=428564 RepID=A0A8D8S0G8_9HEMI
MGNTKNTLVSLRRIPTTTKNSYLHQNWPLYVSTHSLKWSFLVYDFFLFFFQWTVSNYVSGGYRYLIDYTILCYTGYLAKIYGKLLKKSLKNELSLGHKI